MTTAMSFLSFPFKFAQKVTTVADLHTSVLRRVHLSAGQCPRSQSMRVRQLSWTRTPAFITPDLWPPNSRDLNPADYNICGIIQQRVYETKVQDVNYLRQIWSICDLQLNSVIDDATDQWRTSPCPHSSQRTFWIL